MIYIYILLSTILAINEKPLFDFGKGSSLDKWVVIDDVVMGGLSNGYFEINPSGNAVFHGKVSLENNGGFSSVRYRFNPTNLEGYSNIVLYLKGDGKRYQFRVKSDRYDPQSYIYYFNTSGDWQTVSIPLRDMIPSFRGRILDMPNFNGEELEEIAFLIGNKKAEHFKLEIDKITLK